MIKIIHSVSVMDRAGQETLLMNILRNTDPNKIHFSFLCSSKKKGEYDEEIFKRGGNIYYFKRCWLDKIKYLNYFGDIYANFRFFSSHPKEFQILHIHNYHAFTTFLQVLGAKWGGIKTIIVHSHNSNSIHPHLHLFFRKLLNMLNIERFACSKLAAQWMFGNKSEKAFIINNGIILEKFSFDKNDRIELRRNLGISDEQFIIGHIGRFNIQKNHTFLLEIFNEIHKVDKNAKLLLVGKGELEDSIKNKITQLKLENSIFLLGVRDDIRKLFSCFDVFLFPSLFEGLSVVLVEAQTSGLPCIISDTNSVEIKLTDDIHMFSLDDSPQKWANKVLEYKNTKRNYNIDKMRKHGYDIKDVSQILFQKYSELTNQN